MIWEAYLRSAIYAFIFVIGIIGNIFVMFFFGFEMKRSPNFRWFVIHLAIADCTYAIVSPIQMLYLMFSKGKWELGTVLCKMSYLGPITINVSAFIMCSMAYERYRAICHPFGRRLSKRLINLMVALIWVICILLKIPVILRLKVEDGECLLLTNGNTEHLLIGLSFLVFESILPLILLSIFFIQITYELKKHGNFRNVNDSHKVVEEYRRRMTATAEDPDFRTNVNERGPSTSVPPPIVIFSESEEDKENQQSSLIPASPSSVFSGYTGRERVYFSLRRGIAYSGNEDLESHIDSPKSPISPTNDTTAFFANDQNHLNAQQHNHLNSLKENVRNSYTFIKEFVKQRATTMSGPQKLFGISDKNDQATISALFLSVAMFAVTSVPYNLYYFIIICLFLYHPNVEELLHERIETIIIINEWFGVLMLSGCIMNIIIYSGKFPQFRHQAYIWVTKCFRSAEERNLNNTTLNFNPTSVGTNSTYRTACYANSVHRPRSQNNYVTV